MTCRVICLASLAMLAVATPGRAAEWSKEVAVRDGTKTILSFRARLSGGFLVVQALHGPGWHSYAMDNERRAAERLAGRPSLGVEQGVRIEVESGGKLLGSWYQSPPLDLSRPELQWFTWGFDGTATFARRLERKGTDPVALKIGGQVCDGRSCRPIDVRLSVPSGGEPKNAFSTDDLVRVRTENSTKTQDPALQQEIHP